MEVVPEILGLGNELTVSVIEFEVAVLEVKQVAFEVKSQVIASLFAKEVDEKVAELFPMLDPLTFH
jgi:hypothetical protein